MRAAQIGRYGGPEVVSVVDAEPPTPAAEEILLEVAASSINPADFALLNGWMAQYLPISPPLTLGVDVAGTVAAVGSRVSGLAPGDRVYGVAGIPTGGSGAFAEQAVTPAACLGVVPEGTDMATAGTLALVGVSALQTVSDTLGVEEGTRLLVHGAAGGVGQLAVQLASHLGAEVVATARGTGVGVLAELGVEVVDIDRTDLTTLAPFDATLDLVAQDPELPVLVTAPGGRATSLTASPSPELAAERDVSVSLRATEVTTHQLQRLTQYVEEGVLTPRVFASYQLGEVRAAFERKAAGGVHGKLSITVL